jgi:hypothetical protein
VNVITVQDLEDQKSCSRIVGFTYSAPYSVFYTYYSVDIFLPSEVQLEYHYIELEVECRVPFSCIYERHMFLVDCSVSENSLNENTFSIILN